MPFRFFPIQTHFEVLYNVIHFKKRSSQMRKFLQWSFKVIKYIQRFFNREKYLSNKLPVCKNNILDKRKYRFEKWDRSFFNRFWLANITTNWHSCEILKYTVETVVKCFDVLYKEHAVSESAYSMDNFEEATDLHFVFMGDSRIRQQYYNFLQVN